MGLSPYESLEEETFLQLAGDRRSQTYSKHEKDVMHCCWLGDERGHVSSFKELRKANRQQLHNLKELASANRPNEYGNRFFSRASR